MEVDISTNGYDKNRPVYVFYSLDLYQTSLAVVKHSNIIH